MSVYQILVTSPRFDRGRETARRDLLRTQGPMTINTDLLMLVSPEFREGYTLVVDEFNALPESVQTTQLAHWAANGIKEN